MVNLISSKRLEAGMRKKGRKEGVEQQQTHEQSKIEKASGGGFSRTPRKGIKCNRLKNGKNNPQGKRKTLTLRKTQGRKRTPYGGGLRKNGHGKKKRCSTGTGQCQELKKGSKRPKRVHIELIKVKRKGTREPEG